MNNLDFDEPGCIGGPGILADLIDEDILHLGAGERLWKLYCFVSDEGRATGLRHRIYTKVKPDGRLALVTFAVHYPDGDRPVRSGIARVPDLPPEMLDQIINAIRRQAVTSSDDYEEIDLSAIETLSEQLSCLDPDVGP